MLNFLCEYSLQIYCDYDVKLLINNEQFPFSHLIQFLKAKWYNGHFATNHFIYSIQHQSTKGHGNGKLFLKSS